SFLLAGAVAARPRALGRVFPETCVMKSTFAMCAALVGLLALSQSAIAEQKTARQCNDDWSANKTVHSGKRQEQARIHGRVPGRGARSAGIRRGAGGERPIRERSRGQGELPERCRGVGQFHIQNLPLQRQPKLRQDPERSVYGRKRLARGRLSRAEACKGRGDLTSASASEHSSVVTVPSRHRHCSSGRRWDADRRRHHLPAEVFLVAELATTKLTMKTLSLRQGQRQR